MKKYLEYRPYRGPACINSLSIAVCLLLTFMLFSCVTGLIMDDIQNIHRGMTSQEFQSQVKLKPEFAFTIEHEGIQYSIEIYPMQTGTSTRYQYVWTKYGGYTMPVTDPVFTDYFFIYDDKGLFFWGFMNEVQKADDELVQELAPEISLEYKKQLDKKKH